MMEAVGGGEQLCVLLLGHEEVKRREVGCQWESPEEEVRKEVGCQSDSKETRDASVQVDLLTQQLTWSHSGSKEQTEAFIKLRGNTSSSWPLWDGGSSGMLLQCLTVRPDGSDGGALLQHCTTNRTRTRIIRPAIKLSDEPTQTRTRKRPPPQNSDPSRQSVARRQRRRSADLQQEEEEEEEDGGLVEEDTSDPNWTPTRDSQHAPVQQDSDSQHAPVQAVKLEPDSTVCDVCGKVMKNKSSLARHSFIHTGKKPFSCHLCELRFNRRDNLQYHLTHLHPDGVGRREKRRSAAWLCAVCGKTFSCRSRLKTHEVIHSGVKPHRCHLCPKAYMRLNDLEHHKKVVHESGGAEPQQPASLLCDLCGKEFKCRSQLVIHFQTHTGERPHLCDICGRKFARQYQLKRHKILLHANVGAGEAATLVDGAFGCPICGKRLKSQALLDAHTQTHTGDKPHRCSICLRGFQRAACLKQHHARVHLRVRAGEAPLASARRRSVATLNAFPCSVCGRVFRFRSLLASHALVHSDVRPFHCDFCSRCFRRHSHLKRHCEVVHANGARLPETFICHICGKDKKCRSQLARHIIIHTGERPYACDLCSARFNRRGNLQQHRRRMHGVGRLAQDEAPPILFEDDDVMTRALAYKQEETVIAVDSAGELCDPALNDDVIKEVEASGELGDPALNDDVIKEVEASGELCDPALNDVIKEVEASGELGDPALNDDVMKPPDAT
ncbi:zinc finger protein 436 [Austrofundulus limnaeus]|uniref:Zinc finger protein 436 n=1 Tax=Austrofundulus limnaeus TaxID=52670 RepID=A0A2I4DA32_AUSLI|nr:PREDICTED: zinc finger protein 436-like [Austrofundulus limnaeus]